MDSVSFYYHEHELSKMQRDIYEISNFFTLDEEPIEEYTFQTQTGYFGLKNLKIVLVDG